MSTTILTDAEIIAIGKQAGAAESGVNGYVLPIAFARAIEQAVLQSPEIQALRKDAERYRWLRRDKTEQQERQVVEIVIDKCEEYFDATIDAAMEKQP